MSDIFPVISAEDARRSVGLGRSTPNNLSQQARLKLGWPADFNYTVLATSPYSSCRLHFEHDICISVDQLMVPSIEKNILSYCYDYVAATLRAYGFTLKLLTDLG